MVVCLCHSCHDLVSPVADTAGRPPQTHTRPLHLHQHQQTGVRYILSHSLSLRVTRPIKHLCSHVCLVHCSLGSSRPYFPFSPSPLPSVSLPLKGHDLALQLVATFLFPASKMILDSVEPTGIVSVSPHCSQPPSRISAYCLLIELCRGCYDNLVGVAKQLVKLHHHDNPQFAKEWEVCEIFVCKQCCISLHTATLCIMSHNVTYTVPASSGGTVSMWLCWSEERWSHLLHELCTPATLHDQTSQRGGCGLAPTRQLHVRELFSW